MKKLDRMRDIKMRALYIERLCRSRRPEEREAAEAEREILRDRFREEAGDFNTPPMARALKRDFTAFLALIDWACEHCEKREA